MAIKTSHGSLHFSTEVSGKGEAIICLHGFPDNNNSFRHQVKYFTEAGFKVIAPMLRGYEPSSIQPGNDYDAASLSLDLTAQMDFLGIKKAHLIGHDWGAVIAYSTVHTFPERFYSLSTLAVPHLQDFLTSFIYTPIQFWNSWYMFFFQTPWLPEWTIPRDDFAFLEKLWQDWSPGWQYEPEALESVKATFREPGVLEAALAYYRALPDFISAEGRRAWGSVLSDIPVPTLAITGEIDGCLDTRMHDTMNEAGREDDFPAGLRVERIPGAGHFLHQEKPEIVNPLLLDWIKKNS